MEGQPFGEYNGNRVQEAIVLSLCSGMSTGLLALSMVDAAFTRFIAVEKHNISKVVAGNLNRDCKVQPDHTWASDVHDITEQKVKDLGFWEHQASSAQPSLQGSL